MILPVVIREIQVNDRVFRVRNIPLQVMDWFVTEAAKASKVEDVVERTLLLNPIYKELLKKLVIEPKIDDKYLAEEADADDFEVATFLFRDLQATIEARHVEIKKKQPK